MMHKRTLIASLLFGSMLALSAASAQDRPPGSPTDRCIVPFTRDASKLLVLTGKESVMFIVDCHTSAVPMSDPCTLDIGPPGSGVMPYDLRFTDSGIRQNGWACVAANDGHTGWILPDRLGPLPPTPAITTAQWLGTWRNTPDARNKLNNRIVITRASPRVLHVHGESYYYTNARGYPNVARVEADASAFGDTLHIVDGEGTSACVLDLIYHPLTRTFTADDNFCGQFNARFMGEWHRIAPPPSVSR